MKTKTVLGLAFAGIAAVACYFAFFDKQSGANSQARHDQVAATQAESSSEAFLSIRTSLPAVPPAASPASFPWSVPAGQTAGDRIRQLNKSASPKDRFQSFELVRRCAAARSLEANIKSTVQSERRASYPELDEFKGACDGVTDQDMASKRENLKIAVEARVPGSAHEFYMDGFNGDWTAVTQRPDDPLVKEWLHQSVLALQDGAKQGDTSAMLDLNRLYKSGGPVEKDPVQALTYLLARATVMAQRGYPVPDAFVASQEVGLSSDQVATATAAAKGITDKCCKGGK